jgi:hypothetical protein
MPVFHISESEDGASILCWNLESISHSEYVERTDTLTITLVDGYSVVLHGQEAKDVMHFIHTNRFKPHRDPTPEDIADFKEFSKTLAEWSDLAR